MRHTNFEGNDHSAKLRCFDDYSPLNRHDDISPDHIGGRHEHNC